MSLGLAIIRNGDRDVYDKVEGFTFEYLAVSERQEFLRITIAPNTEGRPYSHPGEESHYVIEGQLEITIDGKAHSLNAGDSIWYESVRQHQWANRSDQVVKVISVATPRSYASISRI